MRRTIHGEWTDGVPDRYIQEAAEYEGSRDRRARAGALRAGALRTAAALGIAACLILLLLGILPAGSRTPVTAYACGTELELTASGVELNTGAILDSGEVTGRPLVFFLTGEDIASVRFSCRNQRIRFTDWTERRAGYGSAGNFTVPYGEDEADYRFLMIEWDPADTVAALRRGDAASVADLPPALREDTIVLEFTFADGSTAVKAVEITLQEDGTVYASFGDYAVRAEDSFLRRPDSAPEPAQTFSPPEIAAVFAAADGTPVSPVALWYNLAETDVIRIRWTGDTPVSVRALYHPAGSEPLALERILDVRCPGDGDREIEFPVADWPLSELNGHLHFELEYGGAPSYSGDDYCVFYDPALAAAGEGEGPAEGTAPPSLRAGPPG